MTTATSYRGAMDAADLVPEVDRAFTVTGAATPGWPNPHPDLASPADEEYSRCLDPAKYLILGARLDAWQQVLEERGLMTADDAVRSDQRRRRRPDLGAVTLTRSTWWRPTRPGAVPMLVGRGRLGEVDDAVIEVSAGEPAQLMFGTPHCGCDACDDGSEYLLEDLDESLAAMLRGGVLHVSHGDDYIVRTGGGWESTSGAMESWLEGRYPAGAEVVAGEPWL